MADAGTVCHSSRETGRTARPARPPGRPRPLDEYLRRYPALAADPTALRCVAREEFRQRQQAGQAPDPAEYERRFGVPIADWT